MQLCFCVRLISAEDWYKVGIEDSCDGFWRFCRCSFSVSFGHRHLLRNVADAGFQFEQRQKRFGLLLRSTQTELIYFERLSINIFLMTDLSSLSFVARCCFGDLDFFSLRRRVFFFLMRWGRRSSSMAQYFVYVCL